MRRALWVVAAVIAVTAGADVGLAQTTVNNPGGFSDPFFLYYGWYLPQQNAIANQPRVEDTINYNVAQNQVYAQTNRANLYDPNGGYGRFDPNSSFDPFDPNSRGQGGRGPGGGGGGGGQQMKMRAGVPTSNVNGNGPAMYFNRMAQFYPSIRSGRGPNRNVAVITRGSAGPEAARRAAAAGWAWAWACRAWACRGRR